MANQRREHESLALADALLDLGGVLWCQGQLAEAETLSQEVLAIRRRLLGVEHPSVATALEKLASELYDQGKLAEAEALYRERLQDLRPRLLPGDPRLERALFSLTSHFLKVGKFNEAEPLARESLAISEKQHPDDWQTFNAQSNLGASLLGQKKHAEAERLLLSGCEGMERREEKTADQDRLLCLTVALQRLVRLYEGMERPDQITKWRAEATKCYRWLVEQHRGSIIYFRAADIALTTRELKARGVTFIDEPHLIAPMEDHDLWMAFFLEPAGNTLAIMQEAPKGYQPG